VLTIAIVRIVPLFRSFSDLDFGPESQSYFPCDAKWTVLDAGRMDSTAVIFSNRTLLSPRIRVRAQVED
jgi:hypothetical protein